MDLIHTPAPSDAETLEDFEITMHDALRVGLTSIHDARSFPGDIAFIQRQVLFTIYYVGSRRVEWQMKVVFRQASLVSRLLPLS